MPLRLFHRLALALLFVAVADGQTSPPPDTIAAAYEAALLRCESAPRHIEANFADAVSLRMRRDSLAKPLATIAVSRELATRLIQQGRPEDATSHLGRATDIARSLADPEILLEVYLEYAELVAVVAPGRTEWASQQAYTLAVQLGRPAEQVAAGWLLAEHWYRVNNFTAADELLDAMRALDGVTNLQVDLFRLEHVPSSRTADRVAQWQDLLARARSQGDPRVEARALENLGLLAIDAEDPEQVVAYFDAAEAVQPGRTLTSSFLAAYGRALAQGQDQEKARDVLLAALTATPDSPGGLVQVRLHEALARTLESLGESEAALGQLRQALELQKQIGDSLLPSIALVPAATTRTQEQAAQLAAVQTALRQAELERTQLERGRAVGIATSVALLAALLGLAYLYKRRAASALALARDAAELRAENTRLVALRHQLNPHFLFNALNSLRSRAASGRGDAAGMIDRLTAFCRHALQPQPTGIATVAEERVMLTAYLDIEQARWEDNLRLTLEFDPRADELPLPTLLLLPLVENALKYGAQTSEEHIVAAVRLQRRDDQTLAIEVSNSGRWIDPGSAPRGTSNGVGLDNIRQRLQRLYPDRHRLEIGPSTAGVTAFLELTGEPHLS